MLTAFYMTRVIILTFHGEPRNQHKYEHAHENPPVMTVPLIFLAILSLITGWTLSNGKLFESVLNTNLPEGIFHEWGEHISNLKIAIISTALALISIFSGIYLYLLKPELSARLKQKFSVIFSMLEKRYGFDIFFLKLVDISDFISRISYVFDLEFIDKIAIDGWAYFTYQISKIKAWFDDNVVDGAVDGTGYLTVFFGKIVRLSQTGFVQNYFLFIATIVSFFALIIYYK
jgi:NADH-quinone oxidoreductase subunit L